jgi:very-short-patch-repair endonuclease
MLDFGIPTLSKLKMSLEIIRDKTGLLSFMNKEKQQAVSYVKGIMNQEAPKKDELETLISRTRNGIELRQALDELKNVILDEYVEKLKSQPLENIKTVLESIKSSTGEIPDIQSHEYKLKELTDIQKGVIKICVSDSSVHKLDWKDLVRDEVYAYWIDFIERENPILQGNPIENYTIQKDRLRKLISQKRDLLRKKLIADIQDKVMRIPKFKRNKTYEEVTWSKFVAEVSKQRRLKPLRQFFEDFRNFVFGIAPCWLANPDSVSEVFPLERELFDLIVYDEASQCTVEDAIPSLYRGKRIVIAGDEKQLRPFDLWQIKEDVEDEQDEVITSESLFVLAKRIYGFRYLNWHYRSKYQDLIDFSNHAFYDGRLQVAPNVIHKPERAPIRWVSSNGTWDNNTNLVEAKKVVEEIKNILAENKDSKTLPSIGVITFNEPQQMAILDAIEKRREEDAEFDELMKIAQDPTRNLDDQLFVKNIENVQGDERDIIIFSVAYAKDPHGVFRLQFGTLSQEGGENRLNVAVTRARQEIVVVTSIDPTDITPDQKKNSGRQRFRDYLFYAQAVSKYDEERKKQILSELNEGFTVDNSHDHALFESKFEELVYDRLKALNYNVATQVGYSGYRIDLAIFHPDNPHYYILGVECDGANFHSAQSTRERDVMRQEFLESRGWKIERIWSRDWWKNSQKEINRISNRIEELRKESMTNIKME